MSAQEHPVDAAGDGSDEDDAPSGLIEAADVPGSAGEPPVLRPDVDDAAERRALLELLIYAWDRARSPGVWERLTTGLAAIGVSVERPDGAAFDPALHEVGGVQSTDDPALVDTVAETEVVGFTDRGTVLREPIVVVYRRG
ncbi:MAG: nucleotide exchange factor GrpE [Nakamurella sp.]